MSLHGKGQAEGGGAVDGDCQPAQYEGGGVHVEESVGAVGIEASVAALYHYHEGIWCVCVRVCACMCVCLHLRYLPFPPPDERNKAQQSLSPDVVRVLTELFLCVENLSQEWGTSQVCTNPYLATPTQGLP